MKSANLGKIELAPAFDYLRSGDKNHVEFHDKCVSWLGR
jgi:hypothetical protein